MYFGMSMTVGFSSALHIIMISNNLILSCSIPSCYSCLVFKMCCLTLMSKLQIPIKFIRCLPCHTEHRYACSIGGTLFEPPYIMLIYLGIGMITRPSFMTRQPLWLLMNQRQRQSYPFRSSKAGPMINSDTLPTRPSDMVGHCMTFLDQQHGWVWCDCGTTQGSKSTYLTTSIGGWRSRAKAVGLQMSLLFGNNKALLHLLIFRMYVHKEIETRDWCLNG